MRKIGIEEVTLQARHCEDRERKCWNTIKIRHCDNKECNIDLQKYITENKFMKAYADNG